MSQPAPDDKPLAVCREAWHLKDHVPILQRLRWGEIGFANLRFQQTEGYDLQFDCQIDAIAQGNRAVFDCDWVGNHVRPGGYQLRAAADIWTGNKDEWWDSVELEQVRAAPRLGKTSVYSWCRYPSPVMYDQMPGLPVCI